MEIVLIGLNHRTAPLELRERVHFSPEQASRAAVELRSTGVLEEAVLLSTCNRSEVYGVPASLEVDSAASLEQCLCGFHNLAPARSTEASTAARAARPWNTFSAWPLASIPCCLARRKFSARSATRTKLRSPTAPPDPR
ncbi:MAG: hypothetical protein GZ088_16595 [Acidipila sp.]|nr:hypothetical protein [Acidipila sp.]